MILDLSISSKVADNWRKCEDESISKKAGTSSANTSDNSIYQKQIRSYPTSDDMNTNSKWLWTAGQTFAENMPASSYFNQPVISGITSANLGSDFSSHDHLLQNEVNNTMEQTNLREHTYPFFPKFSEFLVPGDSKYLDTKPYTDMYSGFQSSNVVRSHSSIQGGSPPDKCQSDKEHRSETPSETLIKTSQIQESITTQPVCTVNMDKLPGSCFAIDGNVSVKKEEEEEATRTDLSLNGNRDERSNRHRHIVKFNSLHGKLNKSAVTLMNKWYRTHIDHPYPTIDEKVQLAGLGKITFAQVSSWFANRRNRSSNTWPKRVKRQLFEKLRMITADIEEATRGSVNSDSLCEKICNTIEEHLG